MATDPATIFSAYAALEDLAAQMVSFDYSGLSVGELLDVLSRREKLARSAPVVDHALLAGLQAQVTPKAIGGRNWADVLGLRLHISGPEARRRVRDAENLGPRQSLSGEPLAPVRPQIAAAQAAGELDAEHITALTHFFTVLPSWVDEPTRTQCEATLLRDVAHHSPEELRQAAAALAFLLDQDGPAPDDTERSRKRGLIVGKQGPDGMSDLRGSLDPATRAYLDAVLSKLAAPGMCNPTDEHPCISGTPSQVQIDGDTRTAAQRTHDAFGAALQLALSGGRLGEHNGLPVSVIITTTLQDLERGAGIALTHTGTRLPMGDLVRMAAPAHHYLAIFDQHTSLPLYLGRARRTATAGQRLMLFARDRGCTRPGCTAPADRCQAHHVGVDWQHNGKTDITNLALACGPDNRLADDTNPAAWHTTMGPDNKAHWHPPPLLDTGQPRTNRYHHPQLYEPNNGDGDGGEDSETDCPTT